MQDGTLDFPVIHANDFHFDGMGSSVDSLQTNPFMIFLTISKSTLEEKNPGAAAEDIYEMCGKMWLSLSESDKEPYRSLAKTNLDSLMSSGSTRDRRHHLRDGMAPKVPEPVRVQVVINDPRFSESYPKGAPLDLQAPVQ